jgi:hypothetical protein
VIARPREARVASALAFAMSAVAAAGVLCAALSLSHLSTARDALIGQPGAGDEAVQAVAHIQSDLRFQLLTAGLALVLMLAFGLLLLRPVRWVRGAVWVSAAVLMLGWGCGVAQSTELETLRGSPAFPELQAAFRDLLPGWYSLSIALVVGAAYLLLAALSVALLRGDAAEYYQFGAPRKSASRYTPLRPPPSPPPAPSPPPS